jgi:mannose-6-phosphate isomerase-like protein (cupin superfamily)
MHQVSHDLSRQVPEALIKFSVKLPSHAVEILLTQPEQQVGPCKCRCIHHGDLTIAVWQDPAGFSLQHSHPEAQFTAILSGKFRVSIGEGSAQDLGPGSISHIQSHQPHSIEALTNGTVIDVFQPRRVQLPATEVE